jgi:hypothetical protein
MIFRRVAMRRFRYIPANRMNGLHRPRGIAVVMVLGLLAIAIAISYATLRGQGTTTQLARNNSRSLEARAAARSGIAAAIRKMSENSWAGVGTPLQANVTNNSEYRVTFKTGDVKLLAGDPEYNEWPFRVMIDSVGYAADPLNPAIQSQFKSRCVVQLLRKQILNEPAGWTTLTDSNVYQFSNQDAYVQLPVRMNGKVTLLGKLMFCTEYPGIPPTTARSKYLAGLKLRAATLGDYRPFPLGGLFLKGLLTQQDLTTVTTMLTLDLGTPPLEALLPTAPPSHPGEVLKYRLYPGGDEYDVTPLVSPLSGQTFGPDVKLNPLGIFSSSGTLTIQSNVQITGTIISDNSGGSEIQITGQNVVLRPASLPAMYGSNLTYQLPTVLSKSNFVVNKAADVQLNGAALCWKNFEVKNNDNTTATKLALTGNVITDTLLVRGRSTWTMNAGQWNIDQLAYTVQLGWVNPILYFPDFLQAARGFTVKPTLTFSPDSSGVKPHWHDWSQPVYQPDSADPGLKWEVVRWEEGL